MDNPNNYDRFAGSNYAKEPYWLEFFDWLLKNIKENPKYRQKKIIIEGCDICLIPPSVACKLPLIIMGTSNLQGSLRRIKRDKFDHPDYLLIKNIFREIKRSRGYIKDLNKNKNSFKRNLKKELNK